MSSSFLKVFSTSAAAVIASGFLTNVAFADHDKNNLEENELPMVFNGTVCGIDNKPMALLTSSSPLTELEKKPNLNQIGLTTIFVNPKAELATVERLSQMISIIDIEHKKTQFLMSALPAIAEMAPHLNKDIVLKEAVLKKQSMDAISAQFIRPVLVEAKAALSNLDCSQKESVEEETNELVSDLPKLTLKPTSVNEIASISPHP